MRTYTELVKLKTFLERFEYLKLNGLVGIDTFGFDRIFNQKFYRSSEWKQIREKVIVRDNGCDLGIEGREIRSKIIIHHITPITLADIENGSPSLFDLDNLITTTHNTHNAIHYGDDSLLIHDIVERRPGDTCPWRKIT